MDLEAVLATLRAHEAELRARGIESLSVFGSVARGEAGPDSDVDLAATLAPDTQITSIDLWHLERWFQDVLNASADLIAEPIVGRHRLTGEIERDRAVAF